MVQQCEAGCHALQPERFATSANVCLSVCCAYVSHLSHIYPQEVTLTLYGIRSLHTKGTHAPNHAGTN